ncbi:MAG: hypothetical protein VB080_11225 [Propionicimonas sp.]|uniref:hypothetical protein n=1 Tax=Propionicimonas sp. TaxID=1955623 RepID=UPI002B200AA1|nr:hypothetical protein [Propionicimonas sp.]MEA4944991.1 hypothetical protein [Propionicimonas sp.]
MSRYHYCPQQRPPLPWPLCIRYARPRATLAYRQCLPGSPGLAEWLAHGADDRRPNEIGDNPPTLPPK